MRAFEGFLNILNKLGIDRNKMFAANKALAIAKFIQFTSKTMASVEQDLYGHFPVMSYDDSEPLEVASLYEQLKIDD